MAPPSARTALFGSLLSFLALATVGAGAAFVPAVRRVDWSAATGFAAAAPTHLGSLAAQIALLVNPAPYAVLGAAITGVALLRRRVARAAVVPVLFVATGLTAQVLKASLGHPRANAILGVDLGSWPSGHATAAMTVALCAVLVAPRVLRPAAVVAGGAFALAVGVGVLVLRWHLTTDVVGGYLNAMAWTLGAVAVLRRVERPRRAPAPALPPRWVAGAVIALAGLGIAHVVSGNAATWANYAAAHTWSAVVTAGLSVMALALAATLAVALRR